MRSGGMRLRGLIFRGLNPKRVLLLASAAFVFNAAYGAAGVPESLSFTTELPSTKVEEIPWGKDPFVPLIRHAVPLDLKLTAIFYNRERPSAIINDEIVYRGSVIRGQKVIDIGKSHVILQGKVGKLRLEIASIPELPDVGKKNP